MLLLFIFSWLPGWAALVRICSWMFRTSADKTSEERRNSYMRFHPGSQEDVDNGHENLRIRLYSSSVEYRLVKSKTVPPWKKNIFSDHVNQLITAAYFITFQRFLCNVKRDGMWDDACERISCGIDYIQIFC